MLAEEFEPQVALFLDLVENRTRKADAAGLGKRLEPRRDVHAVAEKVVALDDHVAEVDADAKAHAPLFGQVSIADPELALGFDGAAHRLDRARELGDDAVAGAGEDPAPMVRDQPVDDLSAGVQRADRRLLVLRHEPAVAGHVGGEDRGEAALHRSLLRRLD